MQTGAKPSSQPSDSPTSYKGEEGIKDQILRSTSLSNVNLKCQLQNIFLTSILEYKGELLFVLALLILIAFVKFRYERYCNEAIRVRGIYREILGKLRRQKKLSKISKEDTPSFIGVIQLRDLMLANVNNLKAKLKLWKKISDEVENNSNIRSLIVESHGEIMKVWEWITEADLEED